MSAYTLRSLLSDGLKLLYGAHQQEAAQTEANVAAATSPLLKKALKMGSKQNLRSAKRLEKVFAAARVTVNGRPDPVMQGIIDAGNTMIAETRDATQHDLIQIASGQVAAHYYLATYGTLRNYAKALGNRRVVKLLTKTIEENSIADKKLTAIANKLIDRSDSRVKGGGSGALFGTLVTAGLVGLGVWLSNQPIKQPSR